MLQLLGTRPGCKYVSVECTTERDTIYQVLLCCTRSSVYILLLYVYVAVACWGPNTDTRRQRHNVRALADCAALCRMLRLLGDEYKTQTLFTTVPDRVIRY